MARHARSGAPKGWKSTVTQAARWPVSVRTTAAERQSTRQRESAARGCAAACRAFAGGYVEHLERAARGAGHHRLLGRVKGDALHAALVARQALTRNATSETLAAARSARHDTPPVARARRNRSPIARRAWVSA